MKLEGNLTITKENQDQFKDLVEVTGYLYINSNASLPALTTVGGNINIYSNASFPALTTVGGYLYINSNASFPALTTVGGYLYINSNASFPALTTVGGNINIYSNASFPALTTVGGSIDIYSNASFPALTTVGGSIDIYSNASLPALTTVGGSIDIYSNASLQADALDRNKKLTPQEIQKLRSEPFKKVQAHMERQGYLLADGLFQKILNKKEVNNLTVYKVKHIVKDGESFVIYDGQNYSHGETIEQAKNDLKYKLSTRDVSEFKSWKLTDVKPVEDLIVAYRSITGACSFGVKSFCESRELKESYSLKEVIEMTDGSFGSDKFKEFFA